MAAKLFHLPYQPIFDANGLVVPGAKLNFYATGTLLRQSVYADADLTTPLSNPVVANAAGIFPNIYLDGALVYRLIVTNADGIAFDDGDFDPYVTTGGGSGGGSSAIGLFTAASGLAIDTDTTLVRTSGHTVANLGMADYVYDAAVNAAYVTAYPAAAFIAADGRGFRLSYEQRITPEMFGAIASTVMPDVFTVTAVDNLAELAAMEAWVYSVNPSVERLIVDYSTGTWGLSGKHTITTHYYRSHFYVGGRFQYTGSTSLDALLQVNAIQLAEFSGTWMLFGLQSTGLELFANRKVDCGMILKNNAKGTLGNVYGGNFRRHLIDWDDDGSTATNNNIAMRIENIQATGCGVVGRGGYNTSSAFTATHNAPGSVLEQRSTLTLDAAFVALHRVFDTISFKGRVYMIHAIPTSTTVEVFPWIVDPVTPTAKCNSGTVWSGAGGAIRIRHQDQAGVTMGRVQAVYCGHAIKNVGQYAVNVDTMLAESCNASFELGRGPTDVCRGLRIGTYHSEGTSTQTEVIGGVTYSSGFEGITSSHLRCEAVIEQVSAVGNDGDFDILNGFRHISYETLDATIRNHTNAPNGLQINFAGSIYNSKGYTPRVGTRESGGTREISNSPDRRDWKISSNSYPWTTFYDVPADKALGETNWFRALVVGTGTNGAPTGTVSISLGAADASKGFKLNGGTTTVNFTSTNRPIELYGYFDPSVSTDGGWVVVNMLGA